MTRKRKSPHDLGGGVPSEKAEEHFVVNFHLADPSDSPVPCSLFPKWKPMAYRFGKSLKHNNLGFEADPSERILSNCKFPNLN
jgi:hypothetical protein